MSTRFASQIADLEVEAAAISHELEHAPPEKRGQLKARLAAVQRSLRWYRTRDTGSAVIGAVVADSIATGDAY